MIYKPKAKYNYRIQDFNCCYNCVNAVTYDGIVDCDFIIPVDLIDLEILGVCDKHEKRKEK